MISTVHFGGFGASGGSALRDLFYEYDDIFVFPAEFRLLKEKNGLLDLERSLFISKSPDNIDLAIKDFQNLSINLARVTTKIKRLGFSYDKFTNNQFSKLVNDFIEEIVDYRYPFNGHNYDFRKTYIKSQLDRFASKIFPYSFFEKDAYMAYPSYEKYLKASKKLLSFTFQSAINKENFKPKCIGLHNVVNQFTFEEIYNSANYFDNFKMVIIDRDPRDIFLDFPHHRYIPRNVDNLEKAKCFIKFFKALRLNLNEIQKLEFCLLTSFEELILNYDSTVKKIEDFLGIFKRNKSIERKKFFPEKSIKNIRKYKNLSNDYLPAINLIESELSEYLFHD